MSLRGGTSDAAESRRSIGSDEVHIWSIDLDRADGDLAPLAAGLTPDERDRAERFAFPRDRRRFIVARAALRAILAGYVGGAPSDLEIAYGPHGKPRLAGPSDLEFNLTHSHELALCAVASGRAVGIDLEWLRPMPDLLSTARTALTSLELVALLARPEEERGEVFFRYWTVKEAYLKARGDGLALPLDAFEVAPGPEQPSLLANRIDPADPSRWSFYSLAPAEGYLGALALEGEGCTLHHRSWPGDICDRGRPVPRRGT